MSTATTPRSRQAMALAAMISFRSYGEGAVQAEDEARPHLRILEHGPIHAAHRRRDDVVQVLLAAAVALHRVEAQLQAA